MFVLLSLIKVRDRLNLEWKSKRFFIIFPRHLKSSTNWLWCGTQIFFSLPYLPLKYEYSKKNELTEVYLNLKTRQYRSPCRPGATQICAIWAARVRTGEW